MRELNRREEDQIAQTLYELAKTRFESGAGREEAIKFSNQDIGKAIPREWYDEDIHLGRPAKARIKATARQLFGDTGRHGGKRKGAGRPKGKTTESHTITMPKSAWRKLDRLRGDDSYSRFLHLRIQTMRKRE